MTLVQLIRRNLLLSMILLLIIGSVSHFFIFRLFIHYSTDEVLKEYKQRVEEYITLHDTLALASELVLQPARIEALPIDNINNYPPELYKDTLLYSEMTGSFTPYRQLYFPITYKKQSFLININQPTMESNDLLYAIIASLLVLLVLFLLFMYWISYSLEKSIWKPLNKNLVKLRQYDLLANTKLDLEKSEIQEFDELNEVIMRMVRKINEDYENSRVFAEDASHEMQTPLSIIKSKIDLLLQEEQTKEERMAGVMAMSRAVTRLSRLNKSLLLLSKINNDQYRDKENVDISALMQNYLFDFAELIESKDLCLETSISELHHTISPLLAEILISNLFSNAIRHNIPGGYIRVTANDKILIIENSCDETDKVQDLFSRLIYRKKSEDSSGLGLNIVKSICDKNGITVTYSYPEENLFRIELSFH